MNRFINLYEPANCLIQSMENLMENDDQQMYSELINGLNDGLMGKKYAIKVYTLIFNTRYLPFPNSLQMYWMNLPVDWIPVSMMHGIMA